MKTLRTIVEKTRIDRVRNTDIKKQCGIQDIVRWGRQSKRTSENSPRKQPPGRPPKRWRDSWQSTSQEKMQRQLQN